MVKLFAYNSTLKVSTDVPSNRHLFLFTYRAHLLTRDRRSSKNPFDAGEKTAHARILNSDSLGKFIIVVQTLEPNFLTVFGVKKKDVPFHRLRGYGERNEKVLCDSNYSPLHLRKLNLFFELIRILLKNRI